MGNIKTCFLKELSLGNNDRKHHLDAEKNIISPKKIEKLAISNPESGCSFDNGSEEQAPSDVIEEKIEKLRRKKWIGWSYK